MSRHRQVVHLLGILGVLALTALFLLSSPVSDATAAPKPKPHLQTPAESQLQDARSYAAEYNVSVGQALHRLRAQDQMSGETGEYGLLQRIDYAGHLILGP
jgi:hypothetical protein